MARKRTRPREGETWKHKPTGIVYCVRMVGKQQGELMAALSLHPNTPLSEWSWVGCAGAAWRDQWELHEEESDADRAYRCTKDTPWKPGLPVPVVHEDAREVPDSQRNGWPRGDIITVRCPHCGQEWEEELPQ